MFGRRKAPQPLDDATRAWLSERVPIEADFGQPSPGSQPRYEALRCAHCQGVHLRACPRVQEIEYHENGLVRRVKFWAETQYDASDVIWPEDVFTSEADSTP